MNIRLLALITISLFFINLTAQAGPHAYIKAWTPGTYGNYPGISHQKPPLPIWVRIDFNQSVTQEFADEFFQYLNKQLNPSIRSVKSRAAKHKLGGFMLKVQPSTTREHIQNIIDQTNRHFDPDFKTPQELAILEAEEISKKAILAKIEAEENWQKHLDRERQKKEDQRKKNDAENARRAQVLRDMEAHEQRLQKENQCAYINWKKNNRNPKYQDDYFVYALPINFQVEAERPLNEHGQIAGALKIGSDLYAAVWDLKSGIKRFDKPNSIALAINDVGHVAISCQHAKQIISWNIQNNQQILGPIGKPIMINNKGTILFGCSWQQLMYKWDACNNVIASLDGRISYIDDVGKTYLGAHSAYFPNTQVIDINKKGTILFRTSAGTTLYSNNNHYPVAVQDLIIRDARLNNNDEVISLVNDKIVLWKKDNTAIISSPLNSIIIWIEGYDLRANQFDPSYYSPTQGYSQKECIQYCSGFKLIGFNSSKQILVELGLYDKRYNQQIRKKFYYLLVPKQKMLGNHTK